MKTSAGKLQTIAKTLGAVKSDQFLFSGSLAWAVGQNITISVICPELGTFGVSAEKFSQIIARIDSDVDITFLNGLGKIEENAGLVSKIQLKSKKSKLTLPVLAAPQIPKITIPLIAVAVLDLKQFVEMTTYAFTAAESTQSFSYTGSISLSSSGQTITAAGTDGRRLALVELPCPAPQFELIMPIQVIQAAKVLKGDILTIYQDETNLYFRSSGTTIVARQLAKKFPGFKHMIPATFSTRVKVAAQDMKDSLRRLAPLVDDKCQVLLTVTDKSCIIAISNAVGTGDDEVPVIPVEIDPLFGEFKFIANHVYLTDYFNEVSGEVLMSGTDAGKPIFLECGAKKLLCASMKA